MADEQQFSILENRSVTAWNTWRRRNPQTSVDLSWADLRADLPGAKFHRANLLGRISGGQTCLWPTSPVQTSPDQGLEEAHLGAATFRGASLTRANLCAAELGGRVPGVGGPERDGPERSIPRRTDLRRANLSGADMSGAIVVGTSFGAVDLSNVRIGVSGGVRAGAFAAEIANAGISTNSIGRGQGLRGAPIPNT